MSWDKTKAQTVAEAILYDELGRLKVRAPSAAKYKKQRKGESDQPDLRVGMSVVLQGVDKGSVIGYLRGSVLDWHSEGRAWWDSQTTIIVFVDAVTSEKLDHYVGRFLSTYVNRWRIHLKVVSFDPTLHKWI